MRFLAAIETPAELAARARSFRTKRLQVSPPTLPKTKTGRKRPTATARGPKPMASRRKRPLVVSSGRWDKAEQAVATIPEVGTRSIPPQRRSPVSAIAQCRSCSRAISPTGLCGCSLSNCVGELVSPGSLSPPNGLNALGGPVSAQSDDQAEAHSDTWIEEGERKARGE